MFPWLLWLELKSYSCFHTVAQTMPFDFTEVTLLVYFSFNRTARLCTLSVAFTTFSVNFTLKFMYSTEEMCYTDLS
jgi:hypothetical protein